MNPGNMKSRYIGMIQSITVIEKVTIGLIILQSIIDKILKLCEMLCIVNSSTMQ